MVYYFLTATKNELNLWFALSWVSMLLLHFFFLMSFGGLFAKWISSTYIKVIEKCACLT